MKGKYKVIVRNNKLHYEFEIKRNITIIQGDSATGKTALINMFTNLFIGVSLGANVLAARFYAAGKAKEMSETVHTSIMLALISGVVMAFVGVFFAKGALELMDTPADVIDQAALYMRIYFMGMPFFMLYNYGAAILRAVSLSVGLCGIFSLTLCSSSL